MHVWDHFGGALGHAWGMFEITLGVKPAVAETGSGRIRQWQKSGSGRNPAVAETGSGSGRNPAVAEIRQWQDPAVAETFVHARDVRRIRQWQKQQQQQRQWFGR